MKKIISLVLCFALIFSFAACGEQSPEKQAYEEFSAQLDTQKIITINPRIEKDSNGKKYITADVKNLTANRVSDVVLAFAVWNYKGQPVIIKTQNNPNNTNYEVRLTLPSEVNIPSGEIWNGVGGIFLNEYSPSVKYVKAVVVSCKNGNIKYTNPLYKQWKSYFVNKTLEDWMK